uniref:Integral membrane protein, rhomboid family n=1 Tax=Theileria annulata TaxID=5874 RepID=A0A3B0N6L9_THEAN
MSYVRITNFSSFRNLKQNLTHYGDIFHKLYPQINPKYTNYYTKAPLNTLNYFKTRIVSNGFQQNKENPNYKKHKRNFRYLAFISTASCALYKNKDDNKPSDNLDTNEEDSNKETNEREPLLLSVEQKDSDSTNFDPFEDEDVVYFSKDYTYESPSKDNKYYVHIEKFRYPNPKGTKIPKSFEPDIESFFVNPFPGYFKRVKDQIDTIFDSFFDNSSVNFPNLSSFNPNRNFNSNGNGVHMDPFWVVLSNTSPTTFSKAFMLVCGVVFGLWKLSENTVNTKFSDFMNKHFLTSYEAFKSKRYHTLLTSAISHSSLMHFGFNCMLFHQLMKTFNNHMALYSTQHVNNSLQTFVRSIFSSNSSINVGNVVKKQGRITTNDIFNVMFLSSLTSSLGHVYLYKTPVLGASGAISGLVYLLASTFPNSFFRTVFPLPGLNLSILQIGQLFVATNIYFLMNGRSPNIAWAAHLIGMGTGALYCLFQQYVNKRPGFYNPISLSFKTAKSQWLRTFQGIN